MTQNIYKCRSVGQKGTSEWQYTLLHTVTRLHLFGKQCWAFPLPNKPGRPMLLRCFLSVVMGFTEKGEQNIEMWNCPASVTWCCHSICAGNRAEHILAVAAFRSYSKPFYFVILSAWIFKGFIKFKARRTIRSSHSISSIPQAIASSYSSIKLNKA